MSAESASNDLGRLREGIAIRPLRRDDLEQVRLLFVRVNRELAPPPLRDAFESYIALALREEIDRLDVLYDPADGHGFWVAMLGKRLVGMVGLKRDNRHTAEIRRMYVDPCHRRFGIGRRLLRHAESEAQRCGYSILQLDTAEIQTAAIGLYCSEGYTLAGVTAAETASVRTVGHGIKRLHFEKNIPPGCGARSPTSTP